MQTKTFYDLVFSPDDGNRWYACVYQFDIEGHRPVEGSAKDLHDTELYATRKEVEAVVKDLYPAAELVSVM